MKKNEYTSPEMEIVEITEQSVLMTSDTAEGEVQPGIPPRGGKSRSFSDDEE